MQVAVMRGSQRSEWDLLVTVTNEQSIKCFPAHSECGQVNPMKSWARSRDAMIVQKSITT